MKTAKTERAASDPATTNVDLQTAYLALQKRYDALEERILGGQRHKAEAQLAELAEAKDVIEKLRTRLAEFQDRRERHLEERLRNRATIEGLREALTQERRKNAQAKLVQAARPRGSEADHKATDGKVGGNSNRTTKPVI